MNAFGQRVAAGFALLAAAVILALGAVNTSQAMAATAVNPGVAPTQIARVAR
ncbi:MAG: hypothetical protein ACSLE3_05405 [Microbacteriaceae bacterium]